MNLDRTTMLERFFARDRASDGRFVVGVVTTGIYCLPSCGARKPRPENVRFFRDEDEARSEGLRACRRCHPDRFYSAHDPDRELVSELAARVRACPGRCASVSHLARESGLGATKLKQLVRRHYHTTPLALLTEARVAWAARTLLATRRRILDVGLEAGFESSSTFHDNFRRRTGLSPGAYRRLARQPEFTLRLPADYRAREALAVLARAGAGGSERVDGASFTKACHLAGRAVRLEVRLTPRTAHVRVLGASRDGGGSGEVHGAGDETGLMAAAHRVVVRLLGLECEPEPFERWARRVPGGRRLVAGGEGLRVPRTASAFEAVVWVIVGQQVNLAFASACRDSLVALAGTAVGAGLHAHPTPEQVARLEPSELVAQKYSRRKAEYLVDAARAIVAGELDLDALRGRPADEIAARLGAVRGLGPWSVAYLLMRAYGLADCVPVGDAGLVTALAAYHGLGERPDVEETRELLAPYAPYRSLATYHFWRRLGEPA